MTRFNKYMLRKQADGPIGGGLEALGAGTAALIPYIVMAPMAAGSAVGYLASRMSSPGDSDVKALQKRVMDTEVREKLALSKRRLEQLRKKMLEEQETDTAATSRKRDMFV